MTNNEATAAGIVTAFALVAIGYLHARLAKVEAKLNEANFEKTKAQNQNAVEHLGDDDLRHELDNDLGKSSRDPGRT